MKNKATLVLMEQLIMLLIFALAAAACLGIFSAARNISLSAARQDQAVLLAQNGAEAVKHCRGDLSEAAAFLNGTREDDTVSVPCDGGYWLFIRKTDPGIPGLGTAVITVTAGNAPEDVLFSLETAWQEAA